MTGCTVCIHRPTTVLCAAHRPAENGCTEGGSSTSSFGVDEGSSLSFFEEDEPIGDGLGPKHPKTNPRLSPLGETRVHRGSRFYNDDLTNIGLTLAELMVFPGDSPGRAAAALAHHGFTVPDLATLTEVQRRRQADR